MNIVITGSGRGIGFQSAIQLAMKGEHKVFAISRNTKELKKMSKEVSHERLVVIPCDITELKSIKEAVEKISGMVSGIEVLINNAGRLIKKSFMELTSTDWQEIYDVNVFGVVNVTKAFMPLMLKGSISEDPKVKAHIVNVSSVGGVQGSLKFNGLSAYSSSKGALITLSECLSEELESTGIHVNCIALGSVETEMFQVAFPGLSATAKASEIGYWIGNFALEGHRFFNGKVIPLSIGNP